MDGAARCSGCHRQIGPDAQFTLPPNRRRFCGSCVDALVDLDKIERRDASPDRPSPPGEPAEGDGMLAHGAPSTQLAAVDAEFEDG